MTDDAGSLSSRLHEAVWPIHRRIEALPFFVALARRTLPVERYVDQLRGMAIVTAALERAVATSAEPSVAAAATGLVPRLAPLLDDLAFFDRRGPLPDDPGPVSGALAFAREIGRVAAEEPVRLLGVLYVSEGTAMGNLVHREDARAAAGGADGASWYAGRGGETGPAFREFRERLDSLLLDEEAGRRIVGAAVDAASSFERLHAALDPGQVPERRLLATTFNVEAGRHDVPVDPEVSAAAQRAGERCLDEFPYFLERWGERGRRYTRSDVAWLAALADLEPVDAIAQVVWLAGVLARRGMPSLLLERQLLLLEEELEGLVPESRRAFLGDAARALSSRREAVLPPGVDHRLVEAFAAAAGHGEEDERRRTARVALAAVADESAGLPGALAALASWYASERFPDGFRASFDRLVREALEAVAARGPESKAGAA